MEIPEDELTDFGLSLRYFVMNLEMASNYQKVNMLTGNPHPPNFIIDEMIFPLLYIQMVSVLDEGLDLMIRANGLTSKRLSLGAKIELLNKKGLLENPKDLNKIRERRNEIAHGLFPQTTVEDVKAALSVIHLELLRAGIAGEIPKFDFFTERESVESDKPDPGLAYSHEYIYGLKENEKSILTYSWIVKVTKEAIWT